MTTKTTHSPFQFQHRSFCRHQTMPDGAAASEADNPVLKLSGPLIKLLTLNLVVTCLQGGEHYALLPMLEIGVHQILNEVDFRT